jgi:capsular polysaccharide transport system ATP-binding protein
MAIEFDCFLIDEVMAVGDSRFVEKCNDELFRKRKDRSIVLVSHIPAVVRMVCDSAVVLERGKLHEFECIESAVAFYNEAKADGGPCVAELSHRQQ